MTQKVIKPANPITFPPLFNFSLRTKYIFLAVTAFVFYANSILNKYAFDDNLAIETNAYVQMGFSGIPKILTSDAYAGYYTYWGADPSAQLTGGRYRPLSEIIFAMEQQFFGDSVILPHFRHMVNILAFVICIIAIFYFLEKFLLKKIPYGTDIAFLSTLLFVIHPVHTEVVANIKSLDEILSLLFIMFSFIYSLKYVEGKQVKHLAIGMGSFFLALLSKEYAVTLLFFIPFLFYLLADRKLSSAIIAAIPYYAIFLVYIVLRLHAVGYHNNQSTPILGSNPYLYATHAQKIATEWFVLVRYLGLLFFPFPLAYDYSYYQIPYHNFSDITVLFSILIYISLLGWGIMLARKKNILSFAVFFFLVNIFMVSNFVLDIGATMGERLVFHSSLGFVVILSCYLFEGVSNMQLKTRKIIITATITVTGLVCFGETYIRNTQWKDDTSLDIHDARVVPNSFIATNNAGKSYVLLSEKKDNSAEQAQAYRDSARKYLFRSLYFNPKNEFTYLNLAFVYNDEGLLDSAKHCYDIVKKISPELPLKSYYALLGKLYFAKGLSLAKDMGKPREGITNLKKALMIDSANESIWYDLGIAYYHIHNYDSERYALMKTLQYKPDSFDAAGARKYLQELSQMKNQ